MPAPWPSRREPTLRGGPVTKGGIRPDIEQDYLFPLLKSADVFRGRTSSVSRWMVVPQRRLSDDTGRLERDAPRLWRYLNDNAGALDRRKSVIHRNRPRFGVFGLGGYTFTPFKVAISGMHKSLVFRAVGPLRGKPAVFDDTCYFLSFSSAADCALVAALLSSRTVRELLASLVFPDAKRPVTKRLLQKIDLCALLEPAGAPELLESAMAHCPGLGVKHTEADFARHLSLLRESWATGGGELPASRPRATASPL
jgi:hypothetical protein